MSLPVVVKRNIFRPGHSFLQCLLYAGAGVVILLSGCSPPPPTVDTGFFDGNSLNGWSASNTSYWSAENRVITGHSAERVPKNEFLWSDIEVSDFYLSVDVKLEPNSGNAGIQFRSRKADESGQAVGYQADMGEKVWGKLYHEHDRKNLDWPDDGEKAVRPGEWNHYEILVSGDRIWTAINGVLSVAVRDPLGEKKGKIALQIHSGPPITAQYRINKLVHHPVVELVGLNEKQLEERLRTPLNPPAGQTLGNPKLKLNNNDVVVFTGGANMAGLCREGYIETLLMVANPGKDLHFRNMAWEGDVAAEQFREIGFGGWSSWLDSVGCNVLFAQFGQMESLQGEDSLTSFIDDYKNLLAGVRKGGRQIVVVPPVPFEPGRLKLSGARAEEVPIVHAPVEKYASAIKKMAAEEGYIYVDLFRQMQAQSGYTSDGVRLTDKAQRPVAELIVKELHLPFAYQDSYEPLREQMKEMNSLWFQYWRAGNWAFIYGNELVQPFSRHWQDRNHRILPEERMALESYIQQAEERIRQARARL